MGCRILARAYLLLPFLNTLAKKIFGRLRFAVTSLGLRMQSVLQIVCPSPVVAVAVRAAMGAFGKRAASRLKTDSVQSSSNYLQKLFTKNLLTAR